MELLRQLIKSFWFILIISFGLGQTLKLENNGDGTWNVIYASPLNIAGFQFDVDGAVVISVSGGSAEVAGFMMTASSTTTTVIGFSILGATIPPDIIGDTLVVLDLIGTPTGLSNMVFSDLYGNDMGFTFIWEGCPDDSACNYDENATIDNGNESCTYPASNLVDCDGNCCTAYDTECDMAHPADCAGVCDGSILPGNSFPIDSTIIEICTGCMDDGLQQWSPNSGSSACNYAQFAIIEGICQYNDCNEVCGGTANEDCSGFCLEENDASWDFSCDDCNGIPNGSAYENACENCVGGDTGILDDCFILEKEYENLYYADSVYTIQVFAKNLDGPQWDLESLRSIDIEFQYDLNLLEITGFSLDGTVLGNQGYEISYYNTIVEEQPSLMETKSTIFFNPPNSTYNPIVISPNENIFNIQLETKFISTNSATTEIKINTISLNENSIYIGDWGEWPILLTPVQGCKDPGACNYNPLATYDDESCWSPNEGCHCSDGEGAVINECDICEVQQTGNEDCSCGEDDNRPLDCNGDCPPDECPVDFSLVEGCAIRDECNECVGGATEIYPCEEDCNGDFGGNAYYDYCGVECLAADPSADCSEHCIDLSSDDIDCFSASFKIYNSTGNEVENSTIIETENIFVALFMQNLPNSFEGIIFNLEYNSSFLSLDSVSFNPSGVEAEGELTSELNNSNELFVSVDSTSVDSTIFTAVMYATNEPYQWNGGNILFLEFASLGNSGDSTVISYNRVQVNEHGMKEQNYTSQVIYFGDCNGDWGGSAVMDDCVVCGGPGAIYECLNGGYVGTGGCYDIADDACDCAGNTPEDLYVECVGVDCDCNGILSINESLIPQDFTLSQNYPNPFNPITYIQYSIPHYDFINIDIINISGQIIKTIVQSSHQPGNYEIMWDGTNHYGISVPSGIYFYKMDADEFVSVKKLVLLK